MSTEPDTDELARRVNHFETLFEELRQVVNQILEWKSKITGGITVMVWVVGSLQSIVLVCLGFAANSLNNTATILGDHAVELATANTKIEAFMAQGPRFSAETNAAADAELKRWVQEQIHNEHRK